MRSASHSIPLRLTSRAVAAQTGHLSIHHGVVGIRRHEGTHTHSSNPSESLPRRLTRTSSTGHTRADRPRPQIPRHPLPLQDRPQWRRLRHQSALPARPRHDLPLPVRNLPPEALPRPARHATPRLEPGPLCQHIQDHHACAEEVRAHARQGGCVFSPLMKSHMSTEQ